MPVVPGPSETAEGRRGGAGTVPESLILACVLAVAGLGIFLAALGHMSLDRPWVCRFAFAGRQWSAGPARLAVLLPASFATATVLLRLVRPGSAPLLRFGAWGGVFSMLLALAVGAGGIRSLLSVHYLGPAGTNGEAEVLGAVVVIACGSLGLFSATVAKLPDCRRSSSRPCLALGVPVLIVLAAVAALGILVSGFWADYSLSGPASPGDLALAASWNSVCAGAALAALLVAVAVSRRSNSRLSWGLPFHGLATLVLLVLAGLVVWVLLGSGPSGYRIRWPEAGLRNTLALLIDADRPYSFGLGTALLCLIFIAGASWSRVAAGWGVSPGFGRAAAWLGACVAAASVLAVAQGLVSIGDEVLRFGATVTPVDVSRGMSSSSCLLLAIPVFLAARFLAATCARLGPEPEASRHRWVRGAGLCLLTLGALGFLANAVLWWAGLTDWTPVDAFEDFRAGAIWLRWGALLFLASLAVCGGMAAASGVRDWREHRRTRAAS